MSDELGAHVSASGGVDKAPARAAALDAVVLQLFTKTPNMWREPSVTDEMRESFGMERERNGIQTVTSHDSYLINLASGDAALFERSYASFVAELRRCVSLGIEFICTHPGNATSGDAEDALRRNAQAIARALEEVGGETQVLLETTAGAGRVLGSTFEQLAQMRSEIPPSLRTRVGICFDTCHVYSAGYDLVLDYEGVMAQFDHTIGIEHLRLFHFNDSQHSLGSRKDRHAHIGEGTLGDAPFRSILQDPRFRSVPKLLETPKENESAEPYASDRKNLARLRALRGT